MDSERNRPHELRNDPAGEVMSPQREAIDQQMRQAAQEGMSPQQVADRVFSAILAEQFCILTHPELNRLVRKRVESILQEPKPDYRGVLLTSPSAHPAHRTVIPAVA